LVEILGEVGEALWFILPAYFANSSPVILGGGPPLDFGKFFLDRRRIFGEGKTIRGFVGGLLVGTLVAILQGRAEAGFLLSLGALVGDLIGSFIKRRLDIARGGSLPGVDQVFFLIFALLFASPVERPGWAGLIILLIITPPIHLLANFLAYKLGLKTRPY